MRLDLTCSVLALLLANGCVTSSVLAPYGSELDMPDDVEFAWSSSYNSVEDGIGVVVMADIGVLDPNGDPMEHIEIELTSGYSGVVLIPEEAIQLVDYPEVPSAVQDETDLEEYCIDESGDFDNSEEWCAWYWDTQSEQFYEIGEGYADADGFAPNYLVGETDGRGLFRVYVYVDALPADEDDFEAVPVYANIQVATDSFYVGPQ